MPSYYNPYNFYPASYAGAYYPQVQQPMQQSYTPAPQQGPKMMEWVEGEVGAKAYQMPIGWPANSPIPLWDSTDTVIYLKSWGPMGIPNPLQKLRYEMPEQQSQQMLMSGNGQGGNSGAAQPDMSQYVTKQDFESLRQEIRNIGGQHNGGANQNGNNNAQGGNRGGNR